MLRPSLKPKSLSLYSEKIEMLEFDLEVDQRQGERIDAIAKERAVRRLLNPVTKSKRPLYAADKVYAGNSPLGVDIYPETEDCISPSPSRNFHIEEIEELIDDLTEQIDH